jgi:hypothetical protein
MNVVFQKQEYDIGLPIGGKMIVVVDYGVGNLGSIVNMFPIQL